ncbi:Mur ligase family protein [Atopobiaceae bacterium 24-176]
MTKPRSPYKVPFPVEPMDYGQALDHLHGILRLGICPMLETVVDMLEELGRPDARFDVVQVAGTNGKTSTSRYTAQILSGEGLKTALYTSPELVDYTERMEVGGAPVTGEQFARGIAAAAEAGCRVNQARILAGERPYDITEFDTLTVAACTLFAEMGVDVAVLEVGMGGRWDATTATHPAATCVTGIGLDHTRILGDTLEAIAGEKAAVIKAGQTCVLGEGTAEPPSVQKVLLDRCAEQGVAPTVVRAQGKDAPGGLSVCRYRVTAEPHALGEPLVVDVETPRAAYEGLSAAKPRYQAANIACAVALAEGFLGRPLDAGALAASVAACPTPGRFDLVRQDPPLLVDAAHNPQSIDVFLNSLGALDPSQTAPELVCAVLADKDVAGIVDRLSGAFATVHVCQTPSPRALPAPELAALFEKAGCQVASVSPAVQEALEASGDAPAVAVGSITLAGEVCRLLRSGNEG